MQNGLKISQFVHQAETICTGSLAGHNAVRLMMGRKDRYTFAGSVFFKRMQDLGLYTTDIKEITARVSKLNLDNIFEQKLV